MMNVLALTGEKGILETFCAYLHKFNFDKAKELIDDFRTKNNPTTFGVDDSNESAIWSSLLQCLSQLALADKCYMTLNFLLPKGFLRKESSLRSNYNTIRAELDKLCDGYSEENSGDRSEKLVHHFLQQFRHYVLARIDMMNCYEKLSTLSSGRSLTIDQAVEMVQEIEQNHRGTFYHPSISPLELSFGYECEVLLNLLKCHLKLSRLKFLDCLLLLKEVQSTLKIWSDETTNGASKFQQGSSWFGFNAVSKSHSLPSLCIWLKRFYDALLAKYSLYFYELLSEQTNPQEMRVQMSKLHLNFYQQIVNFHRKFDAGNICLLLNAQDVDHMQWQGYRHPDQRNEPLKGLENYPIIFCHPYEKPAYLLPSVVMILTEHAEKLLQTERIVPVYDKTKEAMFFVTRIETEYSIFKKFYNENGFQNLTTVMNTTTIPLANQIATASTTSSLASFFFNFANFSNLWSNMGVVAAGVFALGLVLWICSCFCCRTKLSQQDSWCWCLCCCPDIEVPFASKRVQGFSMQQPVQAWAPAPDQHELYGSRRAK